MGAQILGVGMSVPTKVLTNAMLSQRMQTSDEWIQQRTGIKERRILEEGRGTADLATEAAKQALANAEISPEQIERILVGTVTPELTMPATAVLVQDALGCKNAAAMDLSAACAGFLYGLELADAQIQSGRVRHCLVIGVEVLSRVLDWEDRNTCILFGDGAGAVVLGPSAEGHGLLASSIKTDGSRADLLTIPGGGTRYPVSPQMLEQRLQFVKMAGRDIFKAAVRNLTSTCQQLLDENGLHPDDIRCVVAHQANLRILEALSSRMNIPMERFFVNIQRYGNTSSASIPIALYEAWQEGRLQQGDLVLMAALGAGLAWGAALLRWEC